jgi:hypothetical protein
LNDNFLDGELRDIQAPRRKSALANFDAMNPGKTIEPLAEGLRKKCAKRAAKSPKERLADKTRRSPTPIFCSLKKKREFSEALQAAASVVVDALSDF